MPFICATALLLGGCAATPQPQPKAPEPQMLVGSWQVDLRPNPGARPYYQQFDVTGVEGKTFTGTFYGAPYASG
jgi:hypothetical protein